MKRRLSPHTLYYLVLAAGRVAASAFASWAEVAQHAYIKRIAEQRRRRQRLHGKHIMPLNNERDGRCNDNSTEEEAAESKSGERTDRDSDNGKSASIMSLLKAELQMTEMQAATSAASATHWAVVALVKEEELAAVCFPSSFTFSNRSCFSRCFLLFGVYSVCLCMYACISPPLPTVESLHIPVI